MHKLNECDKRCLFYELCRVLSVLFEVILVFITMLTSLTPSSTNPFLAMLFPSHASGNVMGIIGMLAAFSFAFSGLVALANEDAQKAKVLSSAPWAASLRSWRRAAVVSQSLAMVISFLGIALVSTSLSAGIEVADVSLVAAMLCLIAALLLVRAFYELLSFWVLWTICLEGAEAETPGDRITPMLRQMRGGSRSWR